MKNIPPAIPVWIMCLKAHVMFTCLNRQLLVNNRLVWHKEQLPLRCTVTKWFLFFAFGCAICFSNMFTFWSMLPFIFNVSRGCSMAPLTHHMQSWYGYCNILGILFVCFCMDINIYRRSAEYMREKNSFRKALFPCGWVLMSPQPSGCYSAHDSTRQKLK